MRDQAIADTNALCGTLDEHARVREGFGVALLDAEVNDISLVGGRVLGVDQRQLRRYRVSFTISDHYLNPYLQNAEVVITLASRPCRSRQIWRRLGDDAEGQHVLRVQNSECPVRPVDLDGEVVPHIVGEGCLEEDVSGVVAHLQEVCVCGRELSGGVGERRTCPSHVISLVPNTELVENAHRFASQKHGCRRWARSRPPDIHG